MHSSGNGMCIYWDRRILGNMPNDMRERIIKVAFEAAIRLN